MKKVSKEEFIRMPAGTLYSRVNKNCEEQSDCMHIKTDKGSQGMYGWMFNGAIRITPCLKSDAELGYIDKWVTEYEIGEYIPAEVDWSDEDSNDFDDDEEIMVYDQDEVKMIIKLLQRMCLDYYDKFDNASVNHILGDEE